MFIKLKLFKKKKKSILHFILTYLNKLNKDDLKKFTGVRVNPISINILRYIRLVLIRLIHNLISFSNFFTVKTKFKITKLEVYCKNYKQKKNIIAKKINLSSEYKILEYKKTYKSKNNFPNVYLYQIENTRVFGDTSCVLTNNYFLYDGIQNLKKERLAEDRFLNLTNLNSTFLDHRYNNSLLDCDEAISLLNTLYFNYAHFVTEILPLIIYIKKKHKNNIPILINNFTNKNILIFLKKIFNKKKVYILKDDHSVFVKKLFIFSKIAHVSHEPKKPKRKRVNEGSFSEPLLKNTNDYFREKIKKNFPIKKKIYVIRPKTYRYLFNQEEIISKLKKAGYFILDPYRYSIERQIFFFQNAKIIISPTGAALANLVFCLNKPKIIIFAPNLSMIFSYWKNLTYNRISNMTYIVGEKSHSLSRYHSNYSIKLNKLNLIKQISQ
jgi:hypothetical protein